MFKPTAQPNSRGQYKVNTTLKNGKGKIVIAVSIDKTIGIFLLMHTINLGTDWQLKNGWYTKEELGENLKFFEIPKKA